MTLHPFLVELQQLGLYTPDPRATRGPATHAGQPPAAGDPGAGRYAASALADEATKVAATPEGGRNHALNRAGFCMGQLVSLGFIDEFTVRLALEDAGHAAGLGRDEVNRTLTSGLAAGRAEPRAGVVLNGGGAIEPAYTVEAPEQHANGAADTGDAVEPPLTWHQRQVGLEVDKLRVRDEARRAYAAEQRGAIEPPEVLTLRERLSRPRAPQRWRIDGWQPLGARVLLAAQYKAGKTTLTGNLVRSLVDGDRWLGRHEVAPVDGTVVVLDFEMSAHQVEDWLRDQRIVNDDKIVIIPLRGKAATFDILAEGARAEWAARLRACGAGYLIVDCLRPILDALGLDEHRDAGQFLVALDALLSASAVPDALVVHHMGHSGERSRGDSRIRDWPDVEWRMVRETDEPASARFVTAFGRDVDIPETQLAFDPTTRRLTLAGGSRRDAAARSALFDVLALLGDADEPLSGRQVEEAMADSVHGQKAIREALKLGARLGSITTRRGPKRSILHTKCVSATSASPVRQRTASQCVSASIDDAHAHALNQDLSASASALFPEPISSTRSGAEDEEDS